MIHSNGLEIEFSRQLVGVYHKEWCELSQLCHNFKLHDHDDQILWRWSESRKYTVHLMYVWEFGVYPIIILLVFGMQIYLQKSELSFG